MSLNVQKLIKRLNGDFSEDDTIPGEKLSINI